MFMNELRSGLAFVADSVDARSLSKLSAALGLFRVLDEGIEVARVEVFLFVARSGDCTMQELSEGLTLSQASCSRNVAALAEVNRQKQPGLGLLEKYQDPIEPRRFRIRLTIKGRQMVRTINQAMR